MTAGPIELSVEGPGPEPACPICRVAVGGDAAICSSCRTPSHRECWAYNGGCATYACPSTPDGMRSQEEIARELIGHRPARGSMLFGLLTALVFVPLMGALSAAPLGWGLLMLVFLMCALAEAIRTRSVSLTLLGAYFVFAMFTGLFVSPLLVLVTGLVVWARTRYPR